MRRAVILVVVLLAVAPSKSAPALASGTWTWPVNGPVIRGFDPPDSPYGSGHRGIDIAAPVGTVVVAAAPGTVTFAGSVGGYLFVTIDHGRGLVSTCSFLSATLVHEDDVVAAGQPIGLSGSGHPGDVTPNLHFGVRRNGEYANPLDYLTPLSVVDLIRLAPIESDAPSASLRASPRAATPRMGRLCATPSIFRSVGVVALRARRFPFSWSSSGSGCIR
jgi:hypothetical protein